MRRLIAGCLVAVLVTGCSQKAPFEELADGPCNSAQEELVNQHISGQINALEKQDWKFAYTFASANFRGQVSLNQFIYVIGSQYSMLIENQGYSFDKCTLSASELTQEVSVTSRGRDYNLTYELSVNEEILGIESAIIGGEDTGFSA